MDLQLKGDTHSLLDTEVLQNNKTFKAMRAAIVDWIFSMQVNIKN